MKFTMLTSLERYFWLTSLVWAASHILGALSLETKNTLPENILDTLKKANASEVRQILKNTRRIIYGKEATSNRPYMVYLKLPAGNPKFNEYRRWLCGGVIIHEEYILTSAACIEDVKHFYVVAGTYKFSYADDRHTNPCIKNGAKKAIWKCIPRNYVFDGHENDNIRWMNNDIAVVKLEDEFDFTRRVRGCEYAPKPICYNNQSASFEEPGNRVSIAGWGSTDGYKDWVNTRRHELDEQNLLEATVVIFNKPQCKKRWGHRYHNIIDNYMICTEDMSAELTEICQEKYVDCTDILSQSDEDEVRRSNDPKTIAVHSANHNYSVQRRNRDLHDGGFCENDHGGPLVYGEGMNAVVIGIISACLVKERTNKCYGPFLYTSVFKNRVLINCAVYKDAGTDCSKLFRATKTHTEEVLSWSDHPDGPAKNEIKAKRRREEQSRLLALVTNNGTATPVSKEKDDSILEHAGLVLRAHDDNNDKKEAIIAEANATVASVANKTA